MKPTTMIPWRLAIAIAVTAACERSTATPTEPSPAVVRPSAPATTPTVATSPTAAAPEDSSPPEPTAATRAERVVRTAEALGELHTEHAHDCAALAAAIVPFHAQRAAVLTDASAEALAWIDAHDDLRLRMRAAMEPVMTASMGCRDHAEFVATQRTLFGAGTAATPRG